MHVQPLGPTACLCMYQTVIGACFACVFHQQNHSGGALDLQGRFRCPDTPAEITYHDGVLCNSAPTSSCCSCRHPLVPWTCCSASWRLTQTSASQQQRPSHTPTLAQRPHQRRQHSYPSLQPQGTLNVTHALGLSCSSCLPAHAFQVVIQYSMRQSKVLCPACSPVLHGQHAYLSWA
jgi:hypothetical protein